MTTHVSMNPQDLGMAYNALLLHAPSSSLNSQTSLSEALPEARWRQEARLTPGKLKRWPVVSRSPADTRLPVRLKIIENWEKFDNSTLKCRKANERTSTQFASRPYSTAETPLYGRILAQTKLLRTISGLLPRNHGGAHSQSIPTAFSPSSADLHQASVSIAHRVHVTRRPSTIIVPSSDTVALVG